MAQRTQYRIVRLLLCGSVAVLVFGSALGADATQSPNESGSPLSDYGDLTALAILAIVLVFIVTKMLPALHEKISAMALAQSTIFADTVKALLDKSEKREELRDVRMQAMVDRNAEAMDHIASAMAALQQHCVERLHEIKRQ